MAGTIIENAVVPIIGAMGGSNLHNVERPDCKHMTRIVINMTATNTITQKEQERVLAELKNTPCEQCAKEKKHGKLS